MTKRRFEVERSLYQLVSNTNEHILWGVPLIRVYLRLSAANNEIPNVVCIGNYPRFTGKLKRAA